MQRLPLLLAALALVTTGCGSSKSSSTSLPQTADTLSAAPAAAVTRGNFSHLRSPSDYGVVEQSATRSSESFNTSWNASNPPPAGWAPYGGSSPFNQALPAKPRLASNSDTVVSTELRYGGAFGEIYAGLSDESNDYYHPIYFASSSDPTYVVHCTGWGYSDVCGPEGKSIHVPLHAQPAGGSDHHFAVIDNGVEYDFWNTRPLGNGRLTAQWGGSTSINGSGLMTNGSATASGFALWAGIIRGPELLAGDIEHALFLAVPCQSGKMVYPALGNDSGCVDGNSADAGARFWLDLSDDQIAALGLPAYKTAVLRALAHFGAFVGDRSLGGMGLSVESGLMYTAMGAADPLKQAMQVAGAGFWGGRYTLELNFPIDLRAHLHVVHPCVTLGNC